jgi:putative endonuclease
MASKKNGTLYVGVTTNLLLRVYEHRNHITEGFTDRYNVDRLVYFETFDDVTEAIKREKHNPEWKDLFDTLI